MTSANPTVPHRLIDAPSPTQEETALQLVSTLNDSPMSLDAYRELAESWRPFRTGAVVLIRAAAWRILPPDALPERERRARAGAPHR